MRAPLLKLGLLAIALSSPSAAAQGRLDLRERLGDPLAASNQADPLAGRQRKEPAMTPADAARKVQSLHGGRVLAVQAEGNGYRVKVLKDGEVRIYSVSQE